MTEPSLPPLDEFIPYLEKIWNGKWLTNNGEFHRRFEAELAEYLGVRHICLFTNGMTALEIGMQALGLSGEVITTPFTFAATPHAIHRNNCTPVFCDIEPETFTIDPARLEALITPYTTAIMAVHVYGNPCRHEELRRIAETYGLKLFYDAAHAFGVEKEGVSVCGWGDLSVLSFHATKVFNTFEGGALVTGDPDLKKRIDLLKNFGIADEVTVVAPGGNGKMDEFRSALGLLQLEHIDGEIARRKKVAEQYRKALAHVLGIGMLYDFSGVRHNFSYFPIRVDSSTYGMTRDELYDRLKREGIMSRRYFYPLCSDFPSYRSLPGASPKNLPVATQVTQEILCLPIFADLSEENVARISNLVITLRKGRSRA